MITTIYGHTATVTIMARRGAGTYDVEVTACATMPSMIGRCYRVTGLELGA